MALKVAEEFKPHLVQLTAPLPQLSLPVLGGVHDIDACVRFLLYWYRRCHSEANDGKDEKDSTGYVVSAHFCWVC
jgi:hypothetical protein